MAAVAETLNLYEAKQAGRDERPVFLQPFFDMTAEEYRITALEHADLLRMNPDSKLNTIYRQGIENFTEKVSKVLNNTAFAKLAIKLSAEGRQLRYSNIEPVVEDYTQSTIEGDTVLEIPAYKITGGKALSYPSGQGDYHPMLNLRVQTSLDKPILVYSGPNEISETPSPGRWIKLPFEMIELTTIL